MIEGTTSILGSHSIEGDGSLDGVGSTAVLASSEGSTVNQAYLLVLICDMLVDASKHVDKVKGEATFEKICKEIFGPNVDHNYMHQLIFLIHNHS